MPKKSDNYFPYGDEGFWSDDDEDFDPKDPVNKFLSRATQWDTKSYWDTYRGFPTKKFLLANGFDVGTKLTEGFCNSICVIPCTEALTRYETLLRDEIAWVALAIACMEEGWSIRVPPFYPEMNTEDVYFYLEEAFWRGDNKADMGQLLHLRWVYVRDGRLEVGERLLQYDGAELQEAFSENTFAFLVPLPPHHDEGLDPDYINDDDIDNQEDKYGIRKPNHEFMGRLEFVFKDYFGIEVPASISIREPGSKPSSEPEDKDEDEPEVQGQGSSEVTTEPAEESAVKSAQPSKLPDAATADAPSATSTRVLGKRNAKEKEEKEAEDGDAPAARRRRPS